MCAQKETLHGKAMSSDRRRQGTRERSGTAVNQMLSDNAWITRVESRRVCTVGSEHGDTKSESDDERKKRELLSPSLPFRATTHFPRENALHLCNWNTTFTHVYSSTAFPGHAKNLRSMVLVQLLCNILSSLTCAVVYSVACKTGTLWLA